MSSEILGGVGIGKINEDWFTTIRLGFGMQLPVPKVGCQKEAGCSTRLRFKFDVPLRLRIVDNDPQQDSIIREEDWDEFSDYLKILRMVEYGHPTDPLHLRLGELGALTVGHGTIMNGYYNVVTTDNFAWGMHGNFNSIYGGVELMLDNFANPEVMGGRVYSRPWGFIDPESFWHRLAVGFSVLMDVNAPLELERDLDGNIEVNPSVSPLVADSQFTSFLGLDIELSVVDESWMHLMPYMDFNVHTGQGAGFHLGTMISTWPIKSLGFNARAEFRWLSDNYLPDYFGPLYEIERYQFAGWGAPLPAPKLRIAASQDRGSVAGWYGDLGVNVLKLVQISGALQDYQGPNNATMWLRADLRQVGPVKLGAMYYKSAFDGFSDAFELDGALAVLEGRVSVAGPLYVGGHYSRLWQLADDGVYTTVDDWNVGAGVAFNL